MIGKQILRSGTSIGAHYREGTRSRSTAEFISKIELGLQELEETIYWMELLVESGIIQSERMNDIMREATELNAIFTTCVKNAKRTKAKEKGRKTRTS